MFNIMNRVNNQLKKTIELSQLLTLDGAFVTYLSTTEESQTITRIRNGNQFQSMSFTPEFFKVTVKVTLIPMWVKCY